MERQEYRLGTVPANQSSTFQSASRKRHYHGHVAFACGRLSVPTYKELKAQLAELKMKAAAVRQQEYDAVLADIRTKVVEFGYTEREIFGSRRGRPRLSRGVSAAKYRDPATGATWSGRGRAPNWIRDAKNRDRFLIRE